MDAVTRTATLFVRHDSKDCRCKDKDKGNDWQKCKCVKTMLLYDGAKPEGQRQWKQSTKRRVWEEAEQVRREWLDSFDPTKIELKRLRMEKELKTVPLEVAVEKFLEDLRVNNRAEGTVTRQALFGKKIIEHFGAETPVLDITPTDLHDWRQTWTFGDSTAAVFVSSVKQFFKFCEAQNWVSASPAKHLKRLEIEQGSRTVPFTDAEYAAVQAQVQKDGDTKLETFLELLRWSGMALVDATLFDTKSVVNGTLDYKRRKTGKRAIVVLPARVVALLNKLPEGQPFRRPDFKLESDKAFWRIQLQDLFERARITEVKTDLGMRPAHPHQLRDTCAVWYIRKGALIQDVAKMLGDTVAMVERHYLPYIEELKDAHVATNKRILKAAGAD
jgi:integrase